MPKIFLIIEREYISRVKKRSFLIMTFLTPLLFVAIAFTPMLLAEVESGEKKQVSVIDYTGL
ncbi:MAG: ABC transporter permease, partial [Bacteroidales bacterium]